jgi:NADP-dependent aldehyde dehydrogenase
MLHAGIAKSFHQKRAEALDQKGVKVISETGFSSSEEESIPTLASVDASTFLSNPLLHKEVFGPFSLLVECTDEQEMLKVAQKMEGQLTTTLIATADEALQHSELIETLKEICGRIIFNGVPTGVEVALSMQHGGPFPATTDARFTAVGADGMKRFARPVCYQNWPNALLPDALKNENPQNLWRTVNNELTKNG